MNNPLSETMNTERSTYKAALLLLANLFSTIGYAVMYSSLELFLSKHLHLSESVSTIIMGVFLGLNYALSLFGSCIGGRFISYRALFSIGAVLQLFSCFLLMNLQTEHFLFIDLALFLLSAGIMTPCINMMLTQQYQHNDTVREKAFLWNYAGMNVGFTLGFILSGYFEITADFHSMFLYSLLSNAVTLLIVLLGWKQLADHSTPLMTWYKKTNNAKKYVFRFFLAIVFLVLTLIAIKFLLTKSTLTQNLLIVISLIVLCFFVIRSLKKNSIEHKKIQAFLILALANLIFWSVYQLIPTGMVFFIDHDVNRKIGSLVISPQVFNIINAVIIAIGGFTFPFLFTQLRKKTLFDIPIQFSLAILGMAISLLLLLLGLHFHTHHGYVSMWWVIISYSIQSVAELLIIPIGTSMIALLASDKLQGVMMGTWMLISGVSAIIAGKISSTITTSKAPPSMKTSSEHFFKLFLVMLIVSSVMGMVLFFSRKSIRRLINKKETVSTH
jgi:proton-dependent oligopeptide transporter, POT family